VAHMKVTIGVGQSGGDEELTWHGAKSLGEDPDFRPR
jgi:hypothetical protein